MSNFGNQVDFIGKLDIFLKIYADSKDTKITLYDKNKSYLTCGIGKIEGVFKNNYYFVQFEGNEKWELDALSDENTYYEKCICEEIKSQNKIKDDLETIVNNLIEKSKKRMSNSQKNL